MLRTLLVCKWTRLLPLFCRLGLNFENQSPLFRNGFAIFAFGHLDVSFTLTRIFSVPLMMVVATCREKLSAGSHGVVKIALVAVSMELLGEGALRPIIIEDLTCHIQPRRSTL